MKLLKAFNKLQSRERLGATLAAAALLYFALDMALIGPLEAERRDLNKQLAAQRLDLSTVKAEATVVTIQLGKDPLASTRRQLAQYRKMTLEAAQFLANADKQPRQVGTLLRQVLAATPGLTLVSLKTLPVTTVYEAKPAAPGAAAASATLQTLATKGALPPAKSAKDNEAVAAPATLSQRSVYRHGIEITVKGNYLALLPYLQQLQSQRLLWADAELAVVSYPESTLRLTIYTLGTQLEGGLG